MIKAVIFDLDGTLVTFKLDVKACRTKVIHYLTEQGLPRQLFSMKETAFDMLVKTKKHITAQDIGEQKFTEIEKTVFSIVESFELEASKKTELFPGITETLQALKELHLKIGLCTISGEKATEYVLDRFGLKEFFEVIVVREDVPEVKPNPVHLEAVLEALNVGSQEAVLVGDSVKDVACASSLNVLAVGVTTGLSSMEELTGSGAHYVASSANDVLALIPKLNNQAQ